MGEGKRKPYQGIETVEDWILFQYAAVIARAIRDKEDKIKTKKELNSKHFGQIVKSYQELKSKDISMSEYFRDEKKSMNMDKVCIYCGSNDAGVTYDHIIPKNVVGANMADHAHNLVFACPSCNSSKGDKEFISWFENKFGQQTLPRKHVMSKYLKFLYRLHDANGTLNHPWTEWDILFG